HPEYGPLKAQLISKWQKEVNDLRVERIFKVEVNKHAHQMHVNYGSCSSNARRRFHGTSCSTECNYFFDLEGAPYESPDSSVCCICIHGFKLEVAGTTAMLSNISLRYGRGLYFSSVSGKADDYAARSEKLINGRKWTGMFAATGAVGRAYLTQEGALPAKMCPPPGYDAVVGEV
ncbi:unnamed protein product, partial [Laminaria digitata]